jgi:hypothetical protein
MKTHLKAALAAAAGAIAASGLVALPAAHAGPDCTVPGPSLDLHHASGYDVTVDVRGASIGPTAVVRSPGRITNWNATGSVRGQAMDFTLTAVGSKAYVHYIGTVGGDGVAHGTSTEIGSPVVLAAGPWNSVTHFTC